ncbi:MAG: hypothetical protein FWC93_01045 [Defluviitaleaceae bacterium]|nr:hypothetical protein [Defluviitaleaceae bacterium]
MKYWFKVAAIFIGLLAALFMIFWGIGRMIPDPVMLPYDNLAHEVHAQIEVDGYINFDDIANFAWDALLVIAPYSNFDMVFRHHNIAWIPTYIGPAANVKLIFLIDNEIVHHSSIATETWNFSRASGLYARGDTVFVNTDVGFGRTYMEHKEN